MSSDVQMGKEDVFTHTHTHTQWNAAAAAAKSLQSCPTLCDPIDGNPPGSAIHGILQARTLEWVAISFSNGILLSHKNKILLFGTTWMDLEGFVLSEISKTGKDKWWMISLTCGITCKNKTDEKQNRWTNKTKLIGTENRLVVATGKMKGIKSYKFLTIK